MRSGYRWTQPRLRAAALVLALFSATAADYSSAAAQSPSNLANYADTLTKYCVVCHNDRLRTADLTLEKADLDHLGARADLWEKVVRKLRTRTMPPIGLPRPDESTYGKIVSSLEAELDKAGARNPDPGHPT